MMEQMRWVSWWLSMALTVTLTGVFDSGTACVYGGERARTLVWRGVLGNSGEAGPTLALGADDPSGRGSGFGVVCDNSGTLWAQGGPGILNRYAVDGRLLASFPLPKESGNNRIARCGEQLVLLLGKQLYLLALDAAPGSAPQPLKIRATALSFGEQDGRVVAYDQELGSLFYVDPRTRQTAAILQLPEKDRVLNLELTPQGRIIVGAQEVVNGALQPVAGMPKHVGDALQWCDNAWFAHNWHGTVLRYRPDFAPAPGVVYGGASGSVIAHLDSDEEFCKGAGMALVGPGLYAISGMFGTVTIFAWDAQQQKLRAVRRIGPFINSGQSIACNGKQVWVRCGNWNWDDSPATPLRNGVAVGGDGQLALLPDGTLTGPARRWGTQPAWVFGALDKEVTGLEEKYAASGLRVNNTGVVLLENKGAFRALLVNRKGEPAMVKLGREGKPQGALPAPQFRTTAPVKAWGTLGAYQGRLYASADGQILEFAPEGEHWREEKRWNSWGTDATSRFGETIAFCLDGADLWVCDTQKHRVLVFDLARPGDSPLSLGGEAGAGSSQFRLPCAVSAFHGKAAVLDAGNARIVRLEKVAAQSADAAR